MEDTPPYAPPPPGRACGAGADTDEPAPGAGPAVNGSVAGGGTAAAAWRVLWRIACRLFWNLQRAVMVCLMYGTVVYWLRILTI